MKQTSDLRVKNYITLIAPEKLNNELPMTEKANETVIKGRRNIKNILMQKDKRLLLIVGPCSIHDEKAAVEYAGRLARLQEKVKETFFIAMRVYFEKPRTTIGWKGLINDPDLNSGCNILEGLTKARRIMLKINELGVPAASEMLEPITPQYLADLTSWAAIGARTVESQTHREMASGLSMPVGFKNDTEGNLSPAINALIAVKTPQSFLGINPEGKPSIVETTGNEMVHIILRGGKTPNYDYRSVEKVRLRLAEKKLPQVIMVDCSHDNSFKDFRKQADVCRNVTEQYINGNKAIIGMMLESNLFEGNQKISNDVSGLRYGISITDGCISWETTEELLLWIDEEIKKAN